MDRVPRMASVEVPGDHSPGTSACPREFGYFQLDERFMRVACLDRAAYGECECGCLELFKSRED